MVKHILIEDVCGPPALDGICNLADGPQVQSNGGCRSHSGIVIGAYDPGMALVNLSGSVHRVIYDVVPEFVFLGKVMPITISCLLHL